MTTKTELRRLTERYFLTLTAMLITALMLMGCSASKTALQPVSPPVNSLTRCSKAPEPFLGDKYEAYIARLLDTYYVCALRHDALVKFYSPQDPKERSPSRI